MTHRKQHIGENFYVLPKALIEYKTFREHVEMLPYEPVGCQLAAI
jgi:hypothetical protein